MVDRERITQIVCRTVLQTKRISEVDRVIADIGILIISAGESKFEGGEDWLRESTAKRDHRGFEAGGGRF
jgi:hypothetical protein